MQDVIIGAVHSHTWSEIEPYAVSLFRTGFRGTRLLLVSNIPQGTREILARMGFTLSECLPVEKPIHFNVDRFYSAHKWLEANPARYVVWTDVRDVVFQSDPVKWLEANIGDSKIIAGSENVLIRHEPCNRQWIHDLFGPGWLSALEGEHVLNGGTFAGTGAAIAAVFDAVYTICTRIDGLPQRDQAVLNKVLRIPEFKAATRIPKLVDGFAAVCHAVGQPQKFIGRLEDEVPTMHDGILYNKRQVPFSIVHQYDRNAPWRAAILQRYKATQNELRGQR